jgi:hypothetical protein
MSGTVNRREIEKRADRLAEEGKFREAADLYGSCYRPFTGYKRTLEIAKKQIGALKKAWSLES